MVIAACAVQRACRRAALQTTLQTARVVVVGSAIIGPRGRPPALASALLLRPGHRNLISTHFALHSLKTFKMLPVMHRHYATDTSNAVSGSCNENAEVLFETMYNARIIKLNRPKALNALNGAMLDLLAPKFEEMQQNPACNVIIIRSDNEKAFCAGGDVKEMVNLIKAGETDKALIFFRREYSFIYKLASSVKPFVSYMNGITMGGGVGLSGHAHFRIATEKTKFAMPENVIGLFPDVGASFLLSRVTRPIGLYLALTGQTINGQEAASLGLASHFMHSERLPLLTQRLSELTDPSLFSVYSAIEEYADPFSLPDSSIFLCHRALIERAFSGATVQQIMETLAAVKSGPSVEFAAQTLERLKASSPLSLDMTLRLLRRVYTLNLNQCLQLEWSLLTKMLLQATDFVEGVTSRLIEKRSEPPTWPSQKMSSDELSALWRASALEKPLSLGDFARNNAPCEFGNMPSESYLRLLVEGMAENSKKYTFKTTDEMIDWVAENWPTKSVIGESINDMPLQLRERAVYLKSAFAGSGKVGIKQHLQQLVSICTEINSEQGLKWKSRL